MMIVRPATIDDLPEYLNLAERFHHDSPMRGVIDFSRDGYSQFYESAVQNESIGVWLAEQNGEIIGICGALAYPMYFNPAATVVQELWWWLTPAARGGGAGAQMFKHIEQWAAEKNATALFMIALEDDRAKKMERLYARAGFTPMERTFMKEVK